MSANEVPSIVTWPSSKLSRPKECSGGSSYRSPTVPLSQPSPPSQLSGPPPAMRELRFLRYGMSCGSVRRQRSVSALRSLYDLFFMSYSTRTMVGPKTGPRAKVHYGSLHLASRPLPSSLENVNDPYALSISPAIQSLSTRACCGSAISGSSISGCHFFSHSAQTKPLYPGTQSGRESRGRAPHPRPSASAPSFRLPGAGRPSCGTCASRAPMKSHVSSTASPMR